MYAIINSKTKKFLCGTDKRGGRMGKNGRWVHNQFTSNDQALTYELKQSAEIDLRCRCCGKDYKVVAVKIEITKQSGE